MTTPRLPPPACVRVPRARRLTCVAVAAVTLSAAPSAAAGSVSRVDVRLSADTVVTVVARSAVTFELGQLRSASSAPAYGVHVTGSGGVRGGLIYVNGLDTGDATGDPYRVGLWVDAADRSTVPAEATSPSLRRTYPAGTYRLHGLGGNAVLGVAAVGGVRVSTARTPRRRLDVTSATATVTAGVPPPVWDFGKVGPGSRTRVVVAAQQFRDVVGPSGPQRVVTCLAAGRAESCATDSRGSYVYGLASTRDESGRGAETLGCLHYYDALTTDAALTARVEAVSTAPVRTLRATLVAWEPPPGA